MHASKVTRRLFFGTAAATGSSLAAADHHAQSADPRSRQAYRIRVEAARVQRDASQPLHLANDDEARYANKIGNFSKGLPHNALGEVDLNAYQLLTQALASGNQADIEKVPMGSIDPATQRKLVNPCAGICFDMEGSDSAHLAIAAAPSVASAETAGEMVELYWQALARDVSFTSYDSDPVTLAASAELSKLAEFRGPKVQGAVTPGALFRGLTPGDLAGPYLSQFLLKSVPFGVQYVEQRMRTVVAGLDHMTEYTDWLNVQNGSVPSVGNQFDPVRRFIRNGRDLGQWVHIDVLYQAYFNAMLTMIQAPDPASEPTGGGMGIPLNPGNPYLSSKNQEGFATFGAPGIATAVAENAARALKAVWYQKWFVHRRLRPEAYGALVHNAVLKGQQYPLGNEVLNSAAVARIYRAHGSYLLPQAFAEGSPLHPAYGAGHATVAGASVTILKAVFDESAIVPNPVVSSPDGLSLVPYTGPDAANLTVGGELNKLATNIAMGRNFAGVHWRSDFAEGLKLGKALALSVLRDQRLTYGEDFAGNTFTLFDGGRVVV